MRESGVWKSIRGAIKSLDPVRVENPIHPGTPDVNYIGGWLELKSLPRLPEADAIFKIKHFTPQQRSWALRRHEAGGRVFMLVRAGNHWILLRGNVAALLIGHAPTSQVLSNAVRVWTSRPTKELARLLRA